MKKFVFIGALFLAYTLSAQFSDTLHRAFAGKKRFDAGFDSYSSFVDHQRVGVYGVKLGVEFGKKISIGGGFSMLDPSTPLVNNYSYWDKDRKRDTVIGHQLMLSYLCYYINYVYYQSRRWELSIPLQFGIGKVGYKFQYKGLDLRDDKGYCFIYEPMINVKFKVFRWVGLEADLGYRIVFQNSSFIQNKFNSPLLAVGVFWVWDEIALSLFPKNEKIQKKFGPSQW